MFVFGQFSWYFYGKFKLENKMRSIFTLLLTSWLSSWTWAQISLPASPAAPQALVDTVKTDNTPSTTHIGYGQQAPAHLSVALTSVQATDFNPGLISDPMLLLQGRVAGLQIYNRGGNPNLPSLLRLRGSSLGANPDPLIVIVGVVGASLANLDPNDVVRITVLKDAAAAGIYGLRGAAGVLLVETRRAARDRSGLQLTYCGQAGMAELAGQVPVMEAAQFLANGGNDLESTTNWRDEVSQLGFSQAHGLALGGVAGNTNFRLSANYRNVKGVLRHSGFEQLNTRMHFTTTALNDRLEVGVDGAFNLRQSNFSFPEAFRYAVSYNPTAPVLGEDAAFPYDSERYGGYFQILGLFDSFNPVSILDQNFNEGRSSGYTLGAHASYHLSPRLKLHARTGQQALDAKTRAFYSPTALFRGNAGAALRRGRELS
jgi:TonB-dependent SusC/RagA subfamily outer membrane receptor